jgi:anion-transporting  ArsA/GET3 family ATPase
MGLPELGNEPHRVRSVDRTAGGSLDAMMLDMKRTFDEIVEAHSDPQRAAAILANPFYQSLSSSFAGTQEYMAMEKLGQLRARADADGTWDLIVVDTPPSRSALDFLDAPRRLGSFLDGRLMRVLVAPAKAGGRAYLRAVGAGLGAVTSVMTRLLGAQVLKDLQAFVAAMDTMFGGFRERAEATYALLQAPGTAFVVVATPEPDALREASYFVERLAAERMPLAGLVVNRVSTTEVPLTPAQSAAAADRLDEVGEHARTAGLLRVHAELAQRVAAEARVVGRFTAAHPAVPWVEAPAQPGDVHDLGGLRRIASDLAG